MSNNSQVETKKHTSFKKALAVLAIVVVVIIMAIAMLASLYVQPWEEKFVGEITMTKHKWGSTDEEGSEYRCANEGCDAVFSITNEKSDEWESECPIKREKKEGWIWIMISGSN